MERNRYLDLLRPLAIGCVVYGHWMLIGLTYYRGQFSDLNVLDYIEWGRWVTWEFQVMPTFFFFFCLFFFFFFLLLVLVGGYANSLSLTAHHVQGERRNWWILRRVMRLWWPTAVYLRVSALAIAVATAAGVAPATIALAGGLVTLQLWFLPMYMVLIALTPAMLAAHRRWGLAVPAAMGAAAAMVSAGVTVLHLAAIGYANYLLVWGSTHQWGFAWRDGILTRPR